MRPQQIYIGVGVGLSSVVACGASQEEIASQAKAAAETQAKAAEAKAAADVQAKAAADVQAKAAADVQAKAAADAAKPKCKLGMVGIRAGRVTLGDTGATSDVEAFCMDTTEVTTEAYAACVASGNCTKSDTGSSCNAGVAGRENHPINCVDWNQAKAYCEAQGQRLPTEEEWKYAATGGDGRAYPWGNTSPSNQLCWNGEGNDLGFQGIRLSTCPVGSYPSGDSPFGLSDMSGNVWEWTSTPDDWARVLRGGGWRDDDPSLVRSAYRYGYDPANRSVNLGFRCAGSPLP